MNRQDSLVLLWATSFFAVATGCGNKDTEAADANEPLVKAESFGGIVVPREATKLYAVSTDFSVGGFGWGSYRSKIEEIAPDGEAVKKGDVVVRFEFAGRDRATQWITRTNNDTIARADLSAVKIKEAARAIETELGRKSLASQEARIDELRAPALSEVEQKKLAIARAIAEFDEQAAEKLVAAHKREAAAAHRYHEADKLHTEELEAHVKASMERFQVVAPHDGVVRHAYNAHERRKVQKGDGLAAGEHVLSIAQGTALSARFFVPEARLANIKKGMPVVVQMPASTDRFLAQVERIEPFPQDMGYFRDDYELPNAYEKAYAVWAKFTEKPSSLTAGSEIRVRAQ